jgi:glycosyltransferase involved in cell wall biosynthesis
VKIYVYPADETGCGYYRLIWPAMSLKASGVDVEIVTKKSGLQQLQGRILNGKMTSVELPPGADVIVLQRPTHSFLQQAIPLIREKNVAVVVDMDDDLTCIDPRNPAWQLLHPGRGEDHSWSNTLPACDVATLVTVSTPALLDVYGRRAPGRLLRNYVPRYFTEVPHDDSIVVGWGGSVHSHPDDLQTMGPAISRLSRESSFMIVGPPDGVKQALGESVAERIETTGAISFLDWHVEIGKRLGIGVAPTADTRFNRAKSWLKALEYASVGVVPVSSDRPEYVSLKEHGVGWTARSPKDWYRSVKRLVNNDVLRRELSVEWRSIVAEHLTIEANAHRWYDAWTEALRIQRA